MSEIVRPKEQSHVWWRKPAPLLQPERNACMSCVTTQILYMGQKTDRLDIAAVDAAIGRRSEQIADADEAYLHLLKQGFAMKSIMAFDTNRFIAEGLAYFQEYYKKDWAPSWDEYFQPEVIQKMQTAHKKNTERYAAYGDRFSQELRNPEIADIEKLLADKSIVVVNVKGSNDLVYHAELIYEKSDNGDFRQYSPNRDNAGLMFIQREALIANFLPEEGIVGIKQ